jgi:hypothetical protein
VKVTTKIELNAQAIAKLESSAKEAMELTMEALKTEINNAQVVPRDHGDLTMSTGVSFGITTKGMTGYISYNTPYARRLYFHPEYNFRTDKNTNARGRWLDEWVYGPRKDWLTGAFLQFWKMQAGGVIK